MLWHVLQDLLRRPSGPPRAFVNPVSRPDEFFGYSEWGFTKKNEVGGHGYLAKYADCLTVRPAQSSVNHCMQSYLSG